MVKAFLPVLAALFIGLCSVTACQREDAPAAGMVTYNSTAQGLRVDYPESWEYHFDDSHFLLFTPKDGVDNPMAPRVFLEVINGLNKDNSRISLEQMAAMGVEQVKSKHGARQVEVTVPLEKVQLKESLIAHLQLLISVNRQKFMEEIFFLPQQNNYVGFYCLSPVESQSVNSATCYNMLSSLNLTSPKKNN